MAADARTLLARFTPCLRYDSLEAYFADAADEWADNPQARLRRSDGSAVPVPQDGLSLAFLGRERYASGEAVLAGDYIESARDDYTEQYLALRGAHPEWRNVVYGRAVADHGRVWLQYWFFYFLNDYALAWGIDVHEGDWEMVQLRMAVDGDEPELAVYAQHTFCEVREWGSVRRLGAERRARGLPVEVGDDDRPLVFAGRGSHASFFEPGFHSTDFYDITDGERRPGVEARLEVLDDETAPWSRWPGHWGGRRTGYPGPGAPCAHDQWAHPERLMTERARTPKLEPAPDAPRLWARRRRGHLLLEFDFSKMPTLPGRLVATVNSADEPGVAPRVHRFGLATAVIGSLQTNVPLAPAKHYDVALAVVIGGDRPTGAQIFLFAPSQGLRGIVSRLGAAAGRFIHLVRMALGAEYPGRM